MIVNLRIQQLHVSPLPGLLMLQCRRIHVTGHGDPIGVNRFGGRPLPFGLQLFLTLGDEALRVLDRRPQLHDVRVRCAVRLQRHFKLVFALLNRDGHTAPFRIQHERTRTSLGVRFSIDLIGHLGQFPQRQFVFALQLSLAGLFPSLERARIVFNTHSLPYNGPGFCSILIHFL